VYEVLERTDLEDFSDLSLFKSSSTFLLSSYPRSFKS